MQDGAEPTPERFFATLQGYQRTAALEAALELDLFTAIDEGATTAEAIGRRVEASTRGTRILCDYMTVLGFLTKDGVDYALATDAAAFLSRKSPAWMGSLRGFLLSPEVTRHYDDLTGAVRRGGARSVEESTVAPDWPTWVEFARSVAPLMAGAAEEIGALLAATEQPVGRVLDIAAGHGLFGIAMARRNPAARIVALDSAAVLEVARENAEQAGVADRYEALAGDAFDTDLGEGFDVALLTNFLHHFDPPTCEGLLRRIRAALAPGGVLVTLEFVPDANRVSPPLPAMFALQMLAGTPAGDAYTFDELETMLHNAGFTQNELREIPGSVERLVISRS